MDSSSIYYDASTIDGNLRFHTEYVEYNSDNSSPENENENQDLSDSTLIGESESRDLYHNDSDDITTNLIPNENTNEQNKSNDESNTNFNNTNSINNPNQSKSMFSLELTNSNVIKPNSSFQFASFIKSDIDNVRNSLNETQDVLRQNIERVTGRGLRLETLEEKAESICSDASEFNNRSGALKRQMWCKNYTFHLFGFMGIFLIVLIVVLSTINYN